MTCKVLAVMVLLGETVTEMELSLKPVKQSWVKTLSYCHAVLLEQIITVKQDMDQCDSNNGMQGKPVELASLPSLVCLFQSLQ